LAADGEEDRALRLATIATPAGLRLHVGARTGYVDLGTAVGDERFSTLAHVLEEGDDALAIVREAADADGSPVAEADFGPAVPSPRRVLCLGLNYRDHALEGGREVPKWPEVFVRGADSIAAPFGPLVKPALSDRFDFEGELGVVIGRGGRYIAARDALDAIAGYVVLNDGSAREWQRAATQWTPGKNFDGTMPIGPEVVTADDVDISDLELTTRLNGEVMQSARTSQMIIDVPSTVEFISSFTTLRPGDVIATGTPGGVGFARKPPVWLTPGDVIEVTIETIGTIRNLVVAETGGDNGWRWKAPVPQGASL
jgi:acylpyruvate hydrolase